MRKKQWTSCYFKHSCRIFRQALRKSRPIRGILKGKVSKMTKFFRLRPWRDSAVSQPLNALTRVVLMVFIAFSFALLAACGGGGSESPGFGGQPPVVPPVTPPITPPVTPPVAVKKGTLLLATCAVEQDKTTCNGTATATSLENVTTTAFQVTGGASVAGPGPVALPLALGTSTVTLSGDGQPLDTKTVTTSCVTGLIPQGNTCVLPPKPTGTITAPLALVADNSNTAEVVVTYTSSNTSTDVTVTLGSETKSVTPGSGTVTFTRAGTNDLTMSLKDKGVEFASGVSKASCNTGSAWDTALKLPGKEAGQCTKILCYSEKVSALMGVAATVYAVDVALAPNGAKIAKDLTGWTVANANGYVPPPAKVAWKRISNPDTFGRVHGLATDSATLTYRKVYWDPVANTINPYGPGTVAPADFNDDYYDVPTYDPSLDNLPKAEVAGGQYFIYNGDVLSQFDIWYQAKGEPKPAPVLVQPNLREFGGNTNIKLLSTWSHTCPAKQ